MILCQLIWSTIRTVAISLAVVLICVFATSDPSSSLATEASPAPAANTVDFSRDIFPLLRRYCIECHGDQKQEASLRLDQWDSLSDSQSIVPGAADESELIRRIELPETDAERMPAIGKSLTAAEIALLRQWIDQGAVWPETIESHQHWAYVAPRRPAIPVGIDSDWVKNEIDWFVLRRLQQEGLKPSPQANPEMLIRRLYLDLTGLPPSVAEARAFAKDPSDAAYAAVVDDLLARPQFGERWARHWLDLARYADSHGFQRDDLRDNWAYRDWVIQAFNQDMPFDRFTIEQLAGDLLPDADESQRIATGFHRSSPTNVEAGSIPEETRIAQVIDRVNTTATIWLGSTLECAQCHDHKFDPFTAKEYYQLLAFFNNTAIEADRSNPKVASSIRFIGPTMALSDPARDAKRAAQQAELKSLEVEKQSRRDQLAVDLEAWTQSIGEEIEDLPQTHVLEIADFTSSGNTDTHQALDDGSILLVGTDPPAKDSYVFRTSLELKNVRAFRLDTLTDPSLPGQGPGRGDAKRSNFVLHNFNAAPVIDGSAGDPLRFVSATADFSQRGFDVARAIDTDPKTAWAISPQFGKPHWATFVLEQPLDAQQGAVIEFRLDQNFGQARTIGRFKISAVTGDVSASPIPARVHELVSTPIERWSAADREQMLDFRAASDKQTKAILRKIEIAKRALDQIDPDQTLVMVEMPKPRASHVFIRGDYKNHGEPVQPGTPQVLHPFSKHLEIDGVANRLSLARWLVDPANPLVARVTVNRWWAELFGTGIVETAEDFGLKGERPSHPELLDYLAVEFQQNRGSIKQILRQIVMSATYRQTSVTDDELLAKDDRNRLLARGPRFRMDAEMIRDNALAIAGILNLRQAGPPIRPYQPEGIWTKVGGVKYDYEVSPGGEQHRRGIYVVLKRGAPYPSFVNFDFSNRLSCSVRRSRTNTPLQALTLLNDPVYVTAAKSLAVQAAADTQRPPDAIVRELFCRCTARDPSDAELGALLTLLEAQRSAAASRPEDASELFQEFAAKPNVSPELLSAWFSVASVLLNLHETIVKP